MLPQIVIASLALLLAVASLLWQAYTYRRSGSRFAVDLSFGVLVGAGADGLVWFDKVPPDGFADIEPETGRPVLTALSAILAGWMAQS